MTPWRTNLVATPLKTCDRSRKDHQKETSLTETDFQIYRLSTSGISRGIVSYLYLDHLLLSLFFWIFMFSEIWNWNRKPEAWQPPFVFEITNLISEFDIVYNPRKEVLQVGLRRELPLFFHPSQTEKNIYIHTSLLVEKSVLEDHLWKVRKSNLAVRVDLQKIVLSLIHLSLNKTPLGGSF